MNIQRYDSYGGIEHDPEGRFVALDDLVKYLHEQIDRIEREIIEDWIDYEDALIIRDIQTIIGHTK